jgi:hypothetical protein
MRTRSDRQAGRAEGDRRRDGARAVPAARRGCLIRISEAVTGVQIIMP